MPADKPGTGEMEGDNQYKVTVEVTDDGSPTLSATLAVTVTVTDVNEAPTIDLGPTDISKPENTPTTEVLGTYMATDQDSGDVLTWTLTGDDASAFMISTGGDLSFAQAPDYEMPADTGGTPQVTTCMR